MPGVFIVIISINIWRAVVLCKLTQDRKVLVNILKTNTEQMSPCPWMSFRKICAVGITSLLHTFGGGRETITEVWRQKLNLYSQRAKDEALLLIGSLRFAFETMQLNLSLVSPRDERHPAHCTWISWFDLCSYRAQFSTGLGLLILMKRSGVCGFHR